MDLLRRTLVQSTVASFTPPLILPRAARAGTYPSRPVRLISGFAPGGPMDIVARLLSGWLAARLGQPVIVENRPGAGGNLGTEAVVRAPPDGHTLLICGPVNTINGALYRQLPFDFARDIAPVAGLVRVPLVMVVHPSVPVATVPDFIAHARSRSHPLAMASAGNGTPQHVSGELFKMMAGIDLLHVPYRGSAPALTDLLGGQAVQVMFDAVPSVVAHIRGGALRALAVTTTTRSDALAGTPVLAEFLPGYEASTWYGVGAPQGTPAAVVERLNRETNTGLADPGLAAQFANLGATPMPGTPADLGRLIAEETEKWGRVVRAAGVRVD
ncbi:Bug family tripartite tricarboxylate transporter substrate binding protein [Plastoroseomonas arctica]|uniref:Tripartite tricarboxylate transporter substrate binding protein n=1 Tax=Plastoroseomonas arctica TaxID=1509237 RepID=A0AAF1JWM9_9PROT|nr:tripartite tricarboxylate transporter substrate binding protein [Plastoroseomonas arctica]MBR0655486.1 tripartite tricarboxylate transporter substrate binding protein [Plastoroseomonas arctica]